MLLRLLRSTLLYRRVREVVSESRALRRAQHRNSLRTKRAAVRARVLLELQHARLRATAAQLDAARTAAHACALQNVLDARDARRSRMRQVMGGHQEVPKGLVQAAGGEGEGEGEGGGAKGMSKRVGKRVRGGEEFKREVMGKVGGMVAGEGGLAGQAVERLVQESVEEVEVGEGETAEMSVRLIAGVAKKAGVTWREMEELIEAVEKEEEGRRMLREALRREMVGEEDGGREEEKERGKERERAL